MLDYSSSGPRWRRPPNSVIFFASVPSNSTRASVSCEKKESGSGCRGSPLEVLTLLAEHSGELVTREQLRSALWSTNTFVDFDHGLNNCIVRIREALDDAAESPRFIETVPRRGYRFVSPVEHVPEASVQTSAKDLPSSNPMEPEKPYAARRRRLAMMLACGAIIGAATALLLVKSPLLRDTANAPTISSLAVLPLENLSGDPAQEYLSDGITDALITDLAETVSAKVISRTSAMRYKKTEKSLPEIARELNVDGIVEGTVQRSGDRVRITAQLIHGPSDKHIWASSYERDLRDVLALQDEVARAIVAEIRIKVTRQEVAQRPASHAVNPEAYEAYLRGLVYSRHEGTEAKRTSLDYFQSRHSDRSRMG